MADPLVQHALQNVWCSPDQDRQTIIKPARISPLTGVLKNIRVKWDTIPLPGSTGYYHVFSVGHVPPAILNLPEARNSWLRLADLHTLKNIYIDFYNTEGLHFPLSLTWMRILNDDSVILAVRLGSNIDVNVEESNNIEAIEASVITWSDENLYIRFYSNAYWNSQRWTNSVNASLQPIIVKGGQVGVDFNGGNFTNLINAIPSPSVGKTLVFHNGHLTSRRNFNSAPVGDTLEFFHDRSIVSETTLNYDDLDEFLSDLDSKQKRIIYPDTIGDKIVYHDDVEFYLLADQGASLIKGVYYHRNAVDAVRMLTHNSYSIVGQYVSGYVLDNEDILIDESSVQVKYYTRMSGYDRPLFTELNHINELYTLPLVNIAAAMSGVNSVVPEWRAENLEAAAYTEIMRSSSEDIDVELVADAYGYNTVTKLMNKSVIRPIGAGDAKYTDLPPGMSFASVFKYGIDGDFLGYGNHLNGSVVQVPLPGTYTHTFELLDGIARITDNTFYGYTTVQSQRSVNEVGFRCYTCPIVSATPNEVWTDVTSGNLYEVSPDGLTITWDALELENLGVYPATRIGGAVLMYQVDLNPLYVGYLKFNVQSEAYWKYPTVDDAGEILERPLTIPPGTFDVFMDGKTLIEGLDYFVNWPEVTITKKLPRKPNEGLEIWVRGSGFCKTNMTRFLPREFGYVRGGMLSDNNQHDVRNDRNIRVVVGGNLKREDQIIFSEEDIQTGTPMVNGQPYAIYDVIAPVEAYLNRDTHEFRNEAVLIDEKVQNYITTIDSGNPAATPVIISGLYQLYSPFISRIIYDLQNGWLGGGELETEYSTLDIETWLDSAGLTDMLDQEPILNDVDLRYVTVHPHNESVVQSLTIEQYTFVETLIVLYFDEKIDLTPFVIVGI